MTQVPSLLTVARPPLASGPRPEQPAFWRSRAGWVCSFEGSSGKALGKTTGTEFVEGRLHVQIQPLNTANSTVPLSIDARKVTTHEPSVQPVPAELQPGRRPRDKHSFTAFLKTRPRDLPRLNPQNWEPVGSKTQQYNCIGHSVRSKQWARPGVRIGDLDAFYREKGFVPLTGLNEVTPKDTAAHDGLEKVIVYGFMPSHPDYWAMRSKFDRMGERMDEGPICTHAVVQEEDGTWTSKNAAFEKIRIADPAVVGGGAYGEPIRVYVRERL